MSKVPTCHLIINFHIKLTVPASQILLTLCSNEVEAGAWLSSEEIVLILACLEPNHKVNGIYFEGDNYKDT
jgi:hypothetical protein